MPSAKEVVNDSKREIVKEIIENMQKEYIFSEERWNKEALRSQNENYKIYIERSQDQVKQVELVVLDDRAYGKNTLWKMTLDELNREKIKGQYITKITNKELKFYTGYIKENHLTNLIYNSLTKYLEKNNISFEDLIQEENEELVGG